MAEELRERSGLKDVTAKKVGVFSVVGMFYALCCAGAYGVEEMIPEVGPGLTFLMLFILPFLWALPYSYMCAELGAVRPNEGGLMLWVKEALGEFWGAMMIWMNFLWGLIANTVYVVLAVGYLGKILPHGFDIIPGVSSFVLESAIKIILVVIFYIINLLGIKEVSIVSTILSVLVVAAFVTVAIVGLAHWQHNPISPFMSDTYDGDVIRTLGGGLAIGIWMYSGFDQISSVAGEIEGSSKVIPKALMIVIPLMILTYILPTIAGLASIGEWESWTTELDGVGYAEVLKEYAPYFVAVLFIVVAIVGQMAIFNMCVATAARAALTLADEHLGPKFLAKLTKKRATPALALTLVAVVTTLLLWFDFTFLVVIDTTFCLLVSALVAIAAYKLKRKIPKEEVIAAGFKPTPKWLHTIFVCLVVMFGIVTVLLDGSDYFFWGIIVAALIPIFYMIGKWVFKGFTVKEPDAYPIDQRTGLGFRDFIKIGWIYLGLGVFSLLGRFFIDWYERDWWAWPGFYSEDWEIYSQKPFDGGEYLNDYEALFFFKNWSFDSFMMVINVAGFICVGLGIIGLVAGYVLSKRDREFNPLLK